MSRFFRYQDISALDRSIGFFESAIFRELFLSQGDFSTGRRFFVLNRLTEPGLQTHLSCHFRTVIRFDQREARESRALENRLK